MIYDYLIVGAGLFGAIFAHEASKMGKKCVVLEKRPHIAGNIYTKEVDGIQVHEYGAHIFHTSDKQVWEYVNQFATFNRYTNCPIARYKEEVYNLPFNMNTFYQLWGVTTPEQARAKIESQIEQYKNKEPRNLEEQAIRLVGTELYEKLIKGYTQKQWGRLATELPSFIIKRLPVRFTYDNNYFNDTYQGIPIGGYTQIIEKMLEGIEVRMNTDFFQQKDVYESMAKKVVFTGMIDQYYEYCYGELEYRSLRFETERIDCPNYQGNAVVNYTEYEIPYTRIIEHKHFEYGEQPNTIITKEYPMPWCKGEEPYYPVNDERNVALYTRYKELAKQEQKVIFGGRLGDYCYYDMHHVIRKALNMVEQELELVLVP